MRGGRLRKFGVRTASALLVGATLLAQAAPAAAEKALRGVALVIGNGDYEHLPKLTNPGNDARAVEELLNGLGFETDLADDRSAKRLRRDLENFAEDAEGVDVAVLYYSGHGIEAGGENYLVPVDAEVDSLQDAGDSLVGLGAVLDELKGSVPVTIVVLDACRNNPFPPGATLRPSPDAEPAPVAAAGLAETRSVVALGGARKGRGKEEGFGTVIAFAASPGQVALDGPPGENSPYAAAILRHLSAMGGEEFGTVMRMVAEEVYLKTDGRQHPWVNESLRRLLYFGSPGAEAPGEDRGILTERRGLLLTIASLPDRSRRQIEEVAREGKVPMDALYAMLKALGAQAPEDPAALEKLLRAQAERLKAVLAERAALKSTDPEIVRLLGLAQQALDEGALQAAQGFYDQAKARVGEVARTVDDAEADVKARRLEFAAVFARSAENLELAFRYREAAQDYAKAFEQAKRWDDEAALLYRTAQAEALSAEGDFSGDNAVLGEAVRIYEDGLGFASREERPMQWAAAQNNLAATLAVLGERETGREHLDAAAKAYDAALSVYTRAEHPDDWASTLGNLGTVRWRLGQREPDGASLGRAVEAFRSALEVQGAKTVPLEWAATQNNLGIVLSAIGEREPGSVRFREAAAAHEASLTEYRRERVPLDWATAQVNLGGALSRLGARERDPRILESSIAAFEAAAGELTRERAPAQWASIQDNLSATLVSLGEATGDASAFERARAAAEDALSVRMREKAPADWADAQLALGNALYRQGAQAGSAELLGRAAAAYEAALGQYDRALVPLDFAATQQNLGAVYGKLGKLAADAALFDKSARAYRAALEVYSPAALPRDFASAQHDLGDVLSAWGEAASDTALLRQAVDAFSASLTVRTRENAPADWANTLYRRGFAEALIGRSEGDAAMLRRGVEDYRAALAVQTRQADPESWAATQWALGFALNELGTSAGDAGVLGEAVAALEAAETGYGEGAERAQIGLDLGYALYGRAGAGGGFADFRQAAAVFERSAAGYKRADDTAGWASAQSGLGNALAMSAAGPDERSALSRAAAAYEAALSTVSRTSAEEDWARLTANRANTLARLGTLTGDVPTMERAAAGFRALQPVRSRERAPEAWVSNQQALAGLLMRLGERSGEAKRFDEAAAINAALAAQAGRDAAPARWASLSNEAGYALTLAGRAARDPARLERAVALLREAVAVQRRINDVPALAYTEDSLCDVLVDLGAMRGEKALGAEAVPLCRSALATFQETGLSDLAQGSATNLKEAEALASSQ